MQRIVFLDRSTVDATFRTPSFPHSWVDHPFTAQEETVSRLSGASIAITNKVRLGEAELLQLPDLKLIAIAATGTDVVDLEACRRRKIAVSNVRDYAAVAVAEHTLALILALSKSVLGWHQDVLRGEWARAKIFCLTGRPVRALAGCTLGIVGYGGIGAEVARLGASFRMEVMIAERRHRPPREGRTPFEEVLARADVLTLHAPLSEETRHLIGEAGRAADQHGARRADRRGRAPVGAGREADRRSSAGRLGERAASGDASALGGARGADRDSARGMAERRRAASAGGSARGSDGRLRARSPVQRGRVRLSRPGARRPPAAALASPATAGWSRPDPS
jgi:glycerate dehydrogenase